VGFTDSHAHLDDARFGADRAEVLARARAVGVERILTIGNGTTKTDFQLTLELAQEHDFLWAALGVHPHEANAASSELLSELEQMTQSPRVIGWGEIGLDYHYDHSPRDVQQLVFRQQLQLARVAKLPVIIHCRDAWDDCLLILGDEWAGSGVGGILHCFSGSAQVARQAADWGFLISFAGNVTFPRAENLRAVAKDLPLDRLLIETDCPYLAPQAMRGKRNEPAFVVEVAAVLGELHQASRGEVAQRTSENFLQLFGLAGA
jgi:TatD DNase family protein